MKKPDWLEPGRRIRSLVDREKMATSKLQAYPKAGEVYTIITWQEHPFSPGWFGVALFEMPVEHPGQIDDIFQGRRMFAIQGKNDELLFEAVLDA